jgi:hypothetical protein
MPDARQEIPLQSAQVRCELREQLFQCCFDFWILPECVGRPYRLMNCWT